jgi:hypothetical protein
MPAMNATLWDLYEPLATGLQSGAISVPFQQGLGAYNMTDFVRATQDIAMRPSKSSGNFAWATYVEIAPSMESGWQVVSALLALVSSWARVQSRYPFLVLSRKNLPESLSGILNSLGATVVNPSDLAKLPSAEHPWSKTQMRRLLVFSLAKFAKIAVVDTDMLFVKNADELFGLPMAPNTVITALDHYSGCKAWGLNAGLVLLQPSADLWNRITMAIKPRSKGCLTPKWKWLFQEAIICLFGSKHMVSKSQIAEKAMMIPYIYNARPASCKCEAVPPPWGITWDDSEIKILNFYASVKPWEMNKVAWQIQEKVNEGFLPSMEAMESWCYMKKLLLWKEHLDDAVRKLGLPSETQLFAKIWE